MPDYSMSHTGEDLDETIQNYLSIKTNNNSILTPLSTPGTTGQFLRGDGQWSATLVGNLTATKFIGNLEGNADTATEFATMGTSGQFYRGDGVWSNVIVGNLTATKFIGSLQGNADSATNSTQLNSLYGRDYARTKVTDSETFNDLCKNYPSTLGMIHTDVGAPITSSKAWWHYIQAQYNNTSGASGNTSNFWTTQIANKPGTTDLWIRSRSGGDDPATNWTAWNRILTMPNSVATASADLNSYTTTGIYAVGASTNYATSSGNQGILFVFFNVGTPFQVFWGDSSIAKPRKRYYSGGTWSAWMDF